MLVKFENESARNLRVSVYVQSKDCTGRKLAGFAAPNGQLTVKVPGDEAVTFEYNLTSAGVSIGAETYCIENLRFTPEAGAAYVFRTTDVSGRCAWGMTGPAGAKVTLTRLRWKRPFTDSSSACSESEAQPDPGFSPLLVER